MHELSSPLQFSIDSAIEHVLGISGERLYSLFKSSLEVRYKALVAPINLQPVVGDKILMKGTTNIYPKWHPSENAIIYLSNKNNDYFGQTDLFYYNLDLKEEKKIKSSVHSAPTWHPDGKTIYYSKKAKFPNKYGSRYYDIYSYDIETEKEERLTRDARAFNPVFIKGDSSLGFIATYDGGQDIYILKLKTKKVEKVTDFTDRPMISHLTFSNSSNELYFDITTHHYRDIFRYNLFEI